MKKKMLFFVNPNAGHSEIRNNLMEVLEIFTLAGYDVTVHPTSRPREITEILTADAEGYDIIVATGGDGTLNETVSGLMRMEKRPLLGYIPGGTVNDVASTLRVPKNPLEAARAIVSGREIEVDVGRHNNNWFTYVAAFGAFTDVAYLTPQGEKRILGRLAYLLAGVKALGEIRPIHVRVEHDEGTIEDDVLFGLVASTTSVGGFKAKGELDICLNDGLHEVVLVRDIKTLFGFTDVASALLRQDFTGPHFHMLQTRNIRFDFDREVPWTLDGEFGGSGRTAVIRNHCRALRIMVPAHVRQLPVLG